ncbi:MAG: hypothetical protein NDI94_04720 [Candidatus Woesearchaeota archaeon]|nr:hypothetical protein [Candidatus Woesearchaeota archaeon]
MKLNVYMILFFSMFLISACTKPCLKAKINVNSCEFGYYTAEKDGCKVTLCRESNEFGCDQLNVGDSYFDGCNTCTCEKEGAACTLKMCIDGKENVGEGKMCGGIAGIECDPGYRCVMDGNYPDAAGKCVPG